MPITQESPDHCHQPTAETQTRYLSSHGSECPVCESSSITAGDRETDGNERLTQEVSCVSCRAKWTEVYKLAEVMDITMPKKKRDEVSDMDLED